MNLSKICASGNFTMLPNTLINDDSMSASARMIVIYLLSKPEGWNVRPADVQKRLCIGKHQYYERMKELREAGYIKLERGGKEGGSRIIVYSEPEKQEKESKETNGKSIENPKVGKPQTREIGRLSNKEVISNKYKTKTQHKYANKSQNQSTNYRIPKDPTKLCNLAQEVGISTIGKTERQLRDDVAKKINQIKTSQQESN